MSRIRTIKPEFWSSEQVMECSPNARLLFIGIWNFCDDAGRHPFAPRQIKALVFPGDSFTAEDVLAMLDDLAANSLIERYTVEGKEYLQVTGWRHQKIDKPQKSRFPGPIGDNSPKAPRTVDERSAPYDDQHINDQGNDPSNESDSAAREDAFARFWEAYPNRVGKAATKAEISAALDRGATIDQILEGVRRYVAAKPPDRQWLSPKNFLADERYLDQPAPRASPPGFSPSEAEAAVPPGMVLIKPGTPQWRAWKRAKPGLPVSDKTGGWYVPSEYPPEERVSA